MEQATNQFNAGLQMDTHPMVQGNDTLTDALNATLITMNGNEVVLQNDMGNRRVDNAFLPAGYEPVGIKEYGGIIYIAAYNPITNKSQIGSFPSPERKISPDDIKDNLKGSFDFSNFESSNNINIVRKVNFLKSDTVLVPLTKEETLHAGDKFVVYSEDLASIKDNITNYDNTSGNKVKTPKNKKYTLSLGVLNSQNEFVDITKTLCRWDGTTIKTYTNKSDLFIFNDAYFIATGEPEGLNYTETQDDLELIKERQIMPANTYAYKLVGPLYLKAELNHIQDFNFNIYGVKTGTSGKKIKADLYIEAFITYNCPDWVSEINDNGDDNYVKYELGEIIKNETNNKGWFDFLVADSDDDDRIITKLSGSIENENELISYDVNTNTYTVKVVKKFSDVYSNNDKLKYYTLGVKVNSKVSDDLYLQNLSQEGVIDFSKLGSGDIDLLGWRFYNNNRLTTLTYVFDAYPKYGFSFKNLTFTFDDVNSTSDSPIKIENLPVYNGRNTLEIDWGNRGIEDQKLYKVSISVNLVKNGTNTVDKNTTFVRWFLSTDLMNDCYAVNSDNFIKDYGNPDSNEKNILDEKLKINLTLELNAINNSLPPDMAKNPTYGSWTKKTTSASDVIEVSFEHKYNLNIALDPKTIIENETNYPTAVTISSPGTVSITGTTLNFDESVINKEPHGEMQEEDLTGFVNTSGISSSRRKIEGTILFYDKFKSKVSFDGTITNPFGNAEEYLKPIMFPDGCNPPKYGGLGLDYNARGGGDGHALNIYCTSSSSVVMVRNNAGAPEASIGKRLAYEEADNGEKGFFYYYNTYSDAINEYFNEKFGNQMCFYVYESTGGNGMHNSKSRPSNPSKFLNTAARVWFKSTDGWAIFSTYKESQSYGWDFIKNNLFKNYTVIYCFADSISCQDAGIAIPDSVSNVYNSKYSLHDTLKVNCSISNISVNVGGTVQCQNDGRNIEWGKIEFKQANTTIQKTVDCCDVNLTSSETFQDEVNKKIDPQNLGLSNIYLTTGSSFDFEGKPLNPSCFYIKNNNNELEINSNLTSNIQINKNYLYNDKYYGILWKGTQHFNPNPQYDVTGWNKKDHWTLFDYSGIKTI